MRYNLFRGMTILALVLAMFTSCVTSLPVDAETEGKITARMIKITLGSDVHSPNRWSYTESEEGVVALGSVDEYYEEDAVKNGYAVPDNTAPGTVDFVFVGLREGEVTLSFTLSNPEVPCAEPESAVEYYIKVHFDKTIEVLFSWRADGSQPDMDIPARMGRYSSSSGSTGKADVIEIEGTAVEKLPNGLYQVELEIKQSKDFTG